MCFVTDHVKRERVINKTPMMTMIARQMMMLLICTQLRSTVSEVAVPLVQALVVKALIYFNRQKQPHSKDSKAINKQTIRIITT